MKIKTRSNPKKALEVFRKLQETSRRYGGPVKGMTKEEVITSIKKTREELWDQYLASRP